MKHSVVSQKRSAQKRFALVAHDHKKQDLIAWALRHQTELARHELFATGTTGRLISF